MVISRLDWKYALHLGLTYAGFDHSVLCEFRQRLIAHDAQRRVFDQLLAALRAAGLLKGKHMQRTDSLAVLAAVRALSAWSWPWKRCAWRWSSWKPATRPG